LGDGQPAPCRAGKTTLAHMVIASRAAVTWSPTHTGALIGQRCPTVELVQAGRLDPGDEVGGTARLSPTLVLWLVNARDVKHLPGRPKTDRLDAVWLARLNERGMLRPSFVPPAQIRQLRDYTRLRSDLTAERGRQVQRLEKLLEDALIKRGTVATDIMGVSGRAMLEALIAGQRDPKVLAELARGRMRGKRGALVQALTGRFDDHHAELRGCCWTTTTP
jgi:hypothetical protein